MNVSISRLKTFKACRRMYEFRYVEGLEPVSESEPLYIGGRYHDFIEKFYNGEDIEPELTKEYAMFDAFRTYIAPKLPQYTPEQWFTYNLNDDDALICRVDGIVTIGDECMLIEHKTSSADITEEYEYDLQFDEQIPAYMLASGARCMYYTVCRKPTIRQRKEETDEEFYQRMREWYDTDTESKIRCFLVERTDDEIETFRTELVGMVNEVKNTHCFYRNTLHCFHWGRRCEYAPICMNYDPNQTYIGFTKEEPNNGTETNH